VISLATARAYGIGVTLSDADLQAAIDEAYRLIEERIGPSGTRQERFTAAGGMLLLSQPADIITTVIENRQELDDSDFESRGAILLRLQTGLHPSYRWRGVVDVEYIPLEADERRDGTALKLLQLNQNTQYGLTQRTIGNYSESFEAGGGSYMDQREAILSGLSDPSYIL